MTRTAKATGLAACAGGIVALVSGIAFDPFELVGEWGVRNGLLAAGVTFLVVLGRGTRWPALVARWLLVAVLGVACWSVVWWLAATATPPWSLEGAWLWPLAIASVGCWAVVVRWSWRAGSRNSLRTAGPRESVR